jgi:epoxyqueuosine reductase
LTIFWQYSFSLVKLARSANMDAIQKKVEKKARDMGARFFGAADLGPARDFITSQGGGFLAEFPRAVSLGITLHDGIVDQLPRHREIPVARTYDYLYYTVNRSLDRIALRISTLLDQNGYKTLLIPASDTLYKEKALGLFSHKLAAHLAGLGWIGPSCLLITPQAGPRVRWVTILTDAPLETGSPLSNGCGECRACVDACPPKAFSGRGFHPEEPRDLRFNVQKCMAYRGRLEEKVTGVRVCGMCIQSCPVGQTGRARP